LTIYPKEPCDLHKYLSVWRGQHADGKGVSLPLAKCEPILRQGVAGWIASTPSDYPLDFGVVGNTRGEAESRFAEAFAAWEVLDDLAKAEAQAAH
jgi:hypothetical protein